MAQQESVRRQPDDLVFEKVLNLRDLGGLPAADGRRVRPGVLYRSAHLGWATEGDVRRLEALGLRTVFDFRNDFDLELDGADVPLAGVRHFRLPLSDVTDGAEFWNAVRTGGLAELRIHLGDGRAERRMSAGYRKYVLERNAEHRRFLGQLADADGVPALWHCSVGKDRAGWSTVIVLLALGVPYPEIEADYLLTNKAIHTIHHRSVGDQQDPEVRSLMAPLFEARTVYLEAALAAVRERWGGTDAYLAEGLGFGAEEQRRLRAALLEG